jgi:hypothetical protein
MGKRRTSQPVVKTMSFTQLGEDDECRCKNSQSVAI